MRPVLAAVLLCTVPLPAVADFNLCARPALVQAYYPTSVGYAPVMPYPALPAPVVPQSFAPALLFPVCQSIPAPLAAPPPCVPSAAPLPAPAAPPTPEPAPPPNSRGQPIRRYYAPSVAEETGLPYEVYPSARQSPGQSGNTVSLRFSNLSDDTLVLKLDGQPYLLPAGKNLDLTARRQFAWQIEGRESERREVPMEEKGLSIVIRR